MNHSFFAAYFLVNQTASRFPIALCWLWRAQTLQRPWSRSPSFMASMSWRVNGRLFVITTVCHWLSKSGACPKNMTWPAVFTLILTRLYVVGQSSIFASLQQQITFNPFLIFNTYKLHTNYSTKSKTQWKNVKISLMIRHHTIPSPPYIFTQGQEKNH